MCSLFVGIGSG